MEGTMLTRGNPNRLLLAALLLAATFMATAPAHAAPFMDFDPADVAEKVMPAVVNINTDKVVERGNNPLFNDPMFRRFFDIPEHRDQDRERRERSTGSGVVISADGYIVTNNHVIEDGESIRVTFNSRESYQAELIGTDPQTDVALIKIEPDRELPYLEFGDSDALRVGERVMAVGNPFGVGQTVTMGIVSAKGRSIGLMDYEDHIQTDASINPGNSGGALVNMRGEVVGINSAILSRSGGSQGIGFAIPANMTQRILDSLRQDGEVRRAWLGVQVQDVNQALADYYGLARPQGVLIARVNEDTPAEKAGLREGDVILAVDGDQVDSVPQLRNKVSLLPVGHEAELQVMRGDDTMTVGVELDALPVQTQTASNRGSGAEDEDGIEGVTVRALTDQLRSRGDIPEDIEGLLVMSVEAGSEAAGEGLRSGDVILEVNTRDVESLDAYRDALREGEDRPILLRVYRPSTSGRIFMAIPR
jgi:Do/DeqQ family serine protease